jgi:hypothetical protein
MLGQAEQLLELVRAALYAAPTPVPALLDILAQDAARMHGENPQQAPRRHLHRTAQCLVQEPWIFTSLSQCLLDRFALPRAEGFTRTACKPIDHTSREILQGTPQSPGQQVTETRNHQFLALQAPNQPFRALLAQIAGVLGSIDRNERREERGRISH